MVDWEYFQECINACPLLVEVGSSNWTSTIIRAGNPTISLLLNKAQDIDVKKKNAALLYNNAYIIDNKEDLLKFSQILSEKYCYTSNLFSESFKIFAQHLYTGKEFLLEFSDWILSSPMAERNAITRYAGSNHVIDILVNFLIKNNTLESINLVKALVLKYSGLCNYMLFNKMQGFIFGETFKEFCKDIFFAKEKAGIITDRAFLLSYIKIDSEDEYNKIFSSFSLPDKVFYFSYYFERYLVSFNTESLIEEYLEFFESEHKIDKWEANSCFAFLEKIIALKEYVNPKIYFVAKKYCTLANAERNKTFLHLLSKFDSKSKEYEDYVKTILIQDDRLEVLKELAKTLPKEKLPWLLSNDKKTLKRIIEKRLSS